jgi:hypothetical protein
MNLSLLTVLVLGIYWGFLPSKIELDHDEKIENKNQVKEFHGIDKLRAPLSWSGVIFKNKNFLVLGIRPLKRFSELHHLLDQTYVIERITLLFASIFSLIIYTGLFTLFFQYAVSIIITVIGIISSIVYFPIKTIIQVIYIFRVNPDDLDSDELDGDTHE